MTLDQDVDTHPMDALKGVIVKSSDDVSTLYSVLKCVGLYLPAISGIKVSVELRDTTVVQRKPYSMSQEKKMWLKRELNGMLAAGITGPPTSTVACPITIVPKKYGPLRLCTDCHQVNCQTELFPFSMARMDDIINEMGGCSWYSRIDLCKGYWQVPLEEETKRFTAYVTLFDVYKYNRLPFGWKNSGAWIQKMMNEVLKNFLGDFYDVCVNDIIIYSRTREQHVDHLYRVL